jgi:vacuolar-type H+-ATPase subunit I/STV1
MEIHPTAWRHNLDARVDVGIGAGDRMEKIVNLNNILQMQERYKERGSLLVDEEKIYNTLNKLITEIGLKEVDLYFNDPSAPEETLLAQNEQLMTVMEQMQAQLQNPLAEQEQIRQQGSLARDQLKIQADMQKFMLDLQERQEQFNQEMLAKLTELELQNNQDVPGSLV